MKRTFAVLLAVCLLLFGLAVTASAETATIASGEIDSITWVLDSTGTLTISGEGQIPHWYRDWYPYYNDIVHVVVEDGITSIGDEAFMELYNMQSVSIADTVLEIGELAFYDCTSLTNVVIPDGVTVIEDDTFNGCTGLKSVDLGNGIITISERAFSCCISLSEIIIENNVQTIESFAFQSCEALKSVTLNEGVTYLGEHAFADTGIKKIHIPASVSDIVNQPFAYCKNLQTITVDATNPYYTTVGSSVLYNKEMTRLLLASKAVSGKYTIPNTVEYIEDQAFYQCDELTEITVPSSITQISPYAFAKCANLKKMTINSTANMWLQNDFVYQSRALKTIVFTGDAPFFSDYAFWSAELTAYYPADNPSWTEEVRQNYDGTITWVAGISEEPVEPDAPVIKVAGVTSSGKPKVSWEKVDGAAKYYVYRSTSKSSGFTKIKSTTGTSYTDKAAEAGEKYYYYVVALNESGDKSEKSEILARTCDLAQPVVEESNVTSSGKIKLKWEKISGAEKYKIYRRVGKSGDYEYYTSTTKTSYTDKDTKAGKVYYYKVLAVHENTSANSAKSAGVGQTCKLAQPVVEESNVASSGKIKLKWEKISGAEKYKIYRRVGKSGDYEYYKSTTSTSYTDKDTKAGKVYYYKVLAVHENTSANSAKSDGVGQTCKLPRPEVSIKLSSGNPKLTWEEVDGAVKYEIYRATSKDGTYKSIKTTTSLKYTDKSVTAGKTYYYKVVAIHSNTSANSAKSSVVSIKAK